MLTGPQISNVKPSGRACMTDSVPRLPLAPGRFSARFQFALLGVVESMIEAVEEKNRLCPPIAYLDKNVDYLTSYLALMAAERARGAYPALAAGAPETRLNPFHLTAQLVRA